MKLTAKHLRHIIHEEFAHVLLEQEEETYRIHLANPPLPGHGEEPYMEEVTGEAALLVALGGVWAGFNSGGAPEELEESDLLVVRVRDNQVVADIDDITWDAQGIASWEPRETGYVASMDADGDLNILKMNPSGV
jgi:hypothetical protein